MSQLKMCSIHFKCGSPTSHVVSAVDGEAVNKFLLRRHYSDERDQVGAWDMDLDEDIPDTYFPEFLLVPASKSSDCS